MKRDTRLTTALDSYRQCVIASNTAVHDLTRHEFDDEFGAVDEAQLEMWRAASETSDTPSPVAMVQRRSGSLVAMFSEGYTLRLSPRRDEIRLMRAGMAFVTINHTDVVPETLGEHSRYILACMCASVMCYLRENDGDEPDWVGLLVHDTLVSVQAH